MYAYYSGVQETLHQDDIDGISFLYASDGGSAGGGACTLGEPGDVKRTREGDQGSPRTLERASHVPRGVNLRRGRRRRNFKSRGVSKFNPNTVRETG
jgi:hypothetical protein